MRYRILIALLATIAWPTLAGSQSAGPTAYGNGGGGGGSGGSAGTQDSAYTPAVGSDWPGTDPGTIRQGLDQAAAQCTLKANIADILDSSTVLVTNADRTLLTGTDITVPTGASIAPSGSGTVTATTAVALAANGANCSAGNYPLGVDASGAVEGCTAAGAGGGAPTDATYITQTANGTLSAEQALSTLSTGLMRVATTTGVITSLTDSAGVAANISDETGTGVLVFSTSPAFTTPNIGSATGSITGNAGTATALAANGANCSAGNYPLGVDASGAVEGCTAAGAGSGDMLLGTVQTVTADKVFNATKLKMQQISGGNASLTGSVTATTDKAFVMPDVAGVLVSYADTPGNNETLVWSTSNNAPTWEATLASADVWKTAAATAWASGAVTASDGVLLNLSAVNPQTTSEGILLPQATTGQSGCAAATAEGQICWQSTTDALYIGNGTTSAQIGGTITSAPALSVSGQTGLMTVTGLASTSRVKTVRDAADTLLELGGSYTPTGTWTSMTLVTPALGTPASGTLTNATGLPVSGIAASTSTALGVGSVELGHASDTTLARVSAGVVSIESVPIDRIIASGTSAMGTGAITSGACATAVTTTATGTATTDVISWTPNADITAVTGYAPVTTGALIIYPYPSTNNVNWKVCNPTASSITPGAVTLNWKVTR